MTAIDRVRALHWPIEYRPGDHYANYRPERRRISVRREYKPKPRPEVVTVCRECQEQTDELLLSESGGYGSWHVVEYPCPTIRAAEGEEN